LKKLFFIAFILLPQWVVAQVNAPLEWYSTMRAERAMFDSASSIHLDIGQYFSWELAPFKKETTADKNWLKWQKSESVFRVIPLVNALPTLGSAQSYSSGSGYSLNGGARIEGSIANKFYFEADGLSGFDRPTPYMQQIYDSLRVIPGFSMANQSGKDYMYHQFGFALGYRISEHFTAIVGRGKNRFGEGYRSLFLSDYAANYNYVKLQAKVWRVRYQMLYTGMRQPYDLNTNQFPTKRKAAVMHYLSLNLAKWWSISAFESIVWQQSNDSISARFYDVNYFNPLIFLRPVEYSIGSPDNALLGASSTMRLKDVTLYGSILIDEFLFGEVIAPIRKRLTGDSTILTGNYRNKQAFQLGVKCHKPFNLKNVSALAEVNVVRPYTYAHGTATQSYTQMNQPLAHPLGANFIEWIAAVTWQPNRWNVGLKAFYYRKGFSTQTKNVGEDPTKRLPNVDFEVSQYGNFITQGMRSDVANVIADAQYILIPEWNLRLTSSAQYRFSRNFSPFNSFMISLGIQSSFSNIERAL
jgi:hypothetical protein